MSSTGRIEVYRTSDFLHGTVCLFGYMLTVGWYGLPTVDFHHLVDRKVSWADYRCGAKWR
jgi:hypothetical protein